MNRASLKNWPNRLKKMMTPLLLLGATGVGYINCSGFKTSLDQMGLPLSSQSLTANELSVSPSQQVMATTSGLQLVVRGGVPPYTYGVVSGDGLITQTGLFFSGPNAGTSQVLVTDTKGAQVSSVLTVSATASNDLPAVNPGMNSALVLAPTKLSLHVGETTDLVVTGGIGPYVMRVISGHGTMMAQTLTAGSTVETIVVGVQDAMGAIAIAPIPVLAAATTMTPASALVFSTDKTNLHAGESATLTVSGGTPPYSLAVTSGLGKIQGMQFLSDGSSSQTTSALMVTDAAGVQATLLIQISSSLQAAAASAALNPGDEFTIKPTGGTLPYTVRIASGGGALSGMTFQAPALASQTSVTITDAAGAQTTIQFTTSTTAVRMPIYWGGTRRMAAVAGASNDPTPENSYMYNNLYSSSMDEANQFSSHYAQAPTSAASFNFFSDASAGHDVTIYQCASGDKAPGRSTWQTATYMLSTDPNCEGHAVERTLGHLSARQLPGTVPIYRYYLNTGFYTAHSAGLTNLPNTQYMKTESVLGYGPE